MRKKFIYFVLVPFLIVLVVLYLFIDRWVEAGLEAGGEAITGAKVEIDHCSVSLSPIAIQWQKLQVANARDPWKNVFETGKVRFALNFGQLLRGKFIIETMEVNDLILGTKRTTDGSLPKHEDKAPATQSPEAGGTFTASAQQALNKTVEQTPVFSLDRLRKGFNPDSLIRSLDLQTLKVIDTLRRQVATGSQQWDAAQSDFESSKKRLSDIETNIKAINPSALKGVDNITAAITTVQNSVKSVNEISQTLNDRKASIEAGVGKLSASVDSLDDVAKGDLQRLLSMARLPELNTGGIAKLLVGQEMYNRALTYLHWIDVARTHIHKRAPSPAEENPPRLKGQNIHFAVERNYPKFWIQKILISGGMDSTQQAEHIHARGEARNITDDQSATGVPLTVALEGAQGGHRALTLAASFDRTKEIPDDEYSATLTGVPLAGFELGRTDFLPAKVANAMIGAGIKVSVPGDRLDSHARIDFSGMKVEFAAEPRNEVEKLVRDVLEGIKAFDVDLRLWGEVGKFDVALATDLDDQIAARVTAVLGAEVARLRDQLRAKLDEKIDAQRREFEKFFAEKKNAVEQQLTANRTLVDQKLALLDGKKKELTDQLAKEQTGKAQDLLKNLLKK